MTLDLINYLLVLSQVIYWASKSALSQSEKPQSSALIHDKWNKGLTQIIIKDEVVQLLELGKRIGKYSFILILALGLIISIFKPLENSTLALTTFTLLICLLFSFSIEWIYDHKSFIKSSYPIFITSVFGPIIISCLLYLSDETNTAYTFAQAISTSLIFASCFAFMYLIAWLFCAPIALAITSLLKLIKLIYQKLEGTFGTNLDVTFLLIGIIQATLTYITYLK